MINIPRASVVLCLKMCWFPRWAHICGSWLRGRLCNRVRQLAAREVSGSSWSQQMGTTVAPLHTPIPQQCALHSFLCWTLADRLWCFRLCKEQEVVVAKDMLDRHKCNMSFHLRYPAMTRADWLSHSLLTFLSHICSLQLAQTCGQRGRRG